jgi:hypothetical protein
MYNIDISIVEKIRQRKKKLFFKDYNNINKLKNEGMTYKAIGNIYGVDSTSLRRFIKEIKGFLVLKKNLKWGYSY